MVSDWLDCCYWCVNGIFVDGVLWVLWSYVIDDFDGDFNY